MLEDKLKIIFCTVPNEPTGRRIAESLVRENLAACVNILPQVISIYRWQGDIQHDGESLLLIKARASRFAAIEARLNEIHPYEVPEIVAVEAADVADAYMQWVRESSGDQNPPPTPD